MADFIGKLPRCSLTKLLPKRQSETLFAQFNPNELEESLRVDYNSVLPRRASHEIINYVGTRSELIPLELFFTGIDRGRTQNWPKLNQQVNDSTAGRLSQPERFLKSCCYADTAEKLFVPPMLIFDWPRIVRIQCKIRRARFRWQHFSQVDGSGLVLVAQLRLQEVPAESRIQAGHVRQFGSIRIPALTFIGKAGITQAETEGRQTVRSSSTSRNRK